MEVTTFAIEGMCITAFSRDSHFYTRYCCITMQRYSNIGTKQANYSNIGIVLIILNTYMDDFKDRLVQAMQSKVISRYKLAKECGISPSTVTNWITGDTTPDRSKITLVSRFLEVNEEWLLTGAGQPQDYPEETLTDEEVEQYRNEWNVGMASEIAGDEDVQLISRISKLPPEKVKNILEEIHKRCDNDSFLLTGTKYPIRPFIDSVYAVCGAPSGFSIAIKEAECEGLSLPFMKEYDFSIKAKGDSMINRNNPSRSIRESDIVVCRLWKSRSHVRWGEVYALATSEGVVIKKLQESEKDGHIKCVSFNTEDGFTPYDLPVEEIYDWAIVVGVVSARNWN